MSKQKKKTREIFRNAVFERDGHKCRICGYKPGLALDAHHITPREVMPQGGYIKENGISLCFKCHFFAEAVVRGEVDMTAYRAENLYKLIDSSYEKAYKVAEES